MKSSINNIRNIKRLMTITKEERWKRVVECLTKTGSKDSSEYI